MPKYEVTMTRQEIMEGTRVIEADSIEEAKRKMIDYVSVDIEWEHENFIDARERITNVKEIIEHP